MRVYRINYIIVLLVFCFAKPPVFAQDKISNSAYSVLEKKFTKTSFGYKYLMYRPVEYSENSAPFPLMVYLHGAGIYGTDLELLKPEVPVKFMVKNGTLPFVVIAPLSRDEYFWNAGNLNAFLHEVLLRNNLDRSRVYLTGMSRGGRGTIQWAVAYPRRFAAIAPVAGGGFVKEADELVDVPVWAFHGAQDQVIPLQYTHNLMKRLHEITNTDIRYTVFQDKGHGIWHRAYSTTELYDWFLRHKNPDPID